MQYFKYIFILPYSQGTQQLHALAGESVCLRFDSDTPFPGFHFFRRSSPRGQTCKERMPGGSRAGKSVCLRFGYGIHFSRIVLFPLFRSLGPDMQRAHAWRLQAHSLAERNVCLRFSYGIHFSRIVLFPLFRSQEPDMQRAHAWRLQAYP